MGMKGLHPSLFPLSAVSKLMPDASEVTGKCAKKKKSPLVHPHLFVALDLGVDKSPQDVGCDGKVDEDQLRLLMEAEEREVVPQLHRLDGVFLLLATGNRGHCFLVFFRIYASSSSSSMFLLTNISLVLNLFSL